jgi:predicted regulator of Ras-like GTPase activity (Roadblock/LC7/MglB family)
MDTKSMKQGAVLGAILAAVLGSTLAGVAFGWTNPASAPGVGGIVGASSTAPALGIGSAGSIASKLALGGSLAIGAAYATLSAPLNGLIVEGRAGIGTLNLVNKLNVAGNLAIGAYFSTSTAPANSVIVEGKIGVGTSDPLAALSLMGGWSIGGVSQVSRWNSMVPKPNSIAPNLDSGGSFASATLGPDSLPIVAYKSGTVLKVLKCGSHDCQSGNIVTSVTSGLPSIGVTGGYMSITIGADALPIISLIAATSTNPALVVVKCMVPDCSAYQPPSIVDQFARAQYTSITISTDGAPFIAYQGEGTTPGTARLKIVKCNDTACNPGTPENPRLAFSTSAETGYYASVAMTGKVNALNVSALPIISNYYGFGAAADLRILKCDSDDCSDVGTADKFLIVDGNVPSTDVGLYTSATVGSDGLPIVSYYDATNGDLKTAHCETLNCSSVDTLSVVDSSGNVGQYTSISIGTDGFPIIAYYDAAGSLKVAKCLNRRCIGAAWITVVDTGNVGTSASLVVGADGLPIIFYHDDTSDRLKAVKCGSDRCVSNWTRR